MHWSLPGLPFILLVAIGAPQHAHFTHLRRITTRYTTALIRTVGLRCLSPGGFIFAASMFGLRTMAQAGFTIGTGTADTFLVRTVSAGLDHDDWPGVRWPSELGRDSIHAADQADRWLRR